MTIRANGDPKKDIARARVEVRLMRAWSCLQDLGHEICTFKDLYDPKVRADIKENIQRMMDGLKDIKKEVE